MNVKKSTNNTWQNITPYKYSTSVETYTSLPQIIYANGNSASIGLKGALSQSAVPSPTAPIQPDECGERTGNLFDKYDNTLLYNTTNLAVTNKWSYGGSGVVIRIPCQANTEYTLSCDIDTTVWRISICSLDDIPTSTSEVDVVDIQRSKPQSGKKTFTTNSDTKYILFQAASSLIEQTLAALMLNSGSTPLPYSPYGYKLDISSGGENLFNGEIEQGSFITTSGKVYDIDTRVRTTFFNKLEAGSYTISANGVDSVVLYAYRESNTDSFDSTESEILWQSLPYTFTLNDERYVRLAFRKNDTNPPISPNDINNIMLNLGSTAKPYSPYNRTTTPIYLGEVETERKVKKLVLTGNENISYNARNDTLGRWVVTIPTPNGTTTPENVISTHFKTVDATAKPLTEGGICMRSTGVDVVVGGLYTDIGVTAPSDSTTIVNAVKSYLAAQYANGTPVTVWYVLAEPTTSIVNEPLRKIGDYADTISAEQAGVSIPTVEGANVIDINTTLKPSEVQLEYEGWHPVTNVHVYPDSSWMPTSWEEFRKAVRSGKAQSIYPVGTKLYENWGDETSDAWIVVDYPSDTRYIDSDLAAQGYTNRVMLMEEKINYLRVFDTKEAWLYVETAIPAGAYRFTIPNYDASYGGNKTYIFTSTANVPVGGQLTLTWAYNTNPTKVQGYSSSTSTSALFDVNIAEWDGTTACTDLGTIKLAMADADSAYGKLNHIHRARYGSNNYYQSGLRQWLNADAAANAWWNPSNIFDRPYDNRNTAGRLNTLNSAMKAVLATPTVNCITNNLFETGGIDGTPFALQTAYTVKDKLFPVTHTEVNLSSSPNVDSVLSYYTGAQNADRIKYRKDNGNAYYWWLRAPYPSYANIERGVYSSGALNSNFASNTFGGVAACIIE